MKRFWGMSAPCPASEHKIEQLSTSIRHSKYPQRKGGIFGSADAVGLPQASTIEQVRDTITDFQQF